MYKNILVPTDLTDKNEPAIREALSMAFQSGGQLHLLHVLEKLGGETDGELEAFYQKLASQADETLTRWQQHFKSEFPGVPIEKLIAVGKRAPEIIHYCREVKIDLIVMAARIIKPEQQSFGTLSHQVALFAPVSVLMVR
tara:strand:- start:83 stop:502 length:420 start_codon:yes stop_codon:yes gene_type:complete